MPLCPKPARLAALLLSLSLAACGSAGGDGAGGQSAAPPGPSPGAATGGGGGGQSGAPPGPSPGAATGGGGGQNAAPPAAPGFEADQQAFQKLRVEADTAAALDAAGAKAKYGVKFRERLSYDPLTSQNMDKIRGSALALSSADEALLAKNGFAIAKGRAFPTFLTGLASIYSEHLPVYVSADAILESVHSSYDKILGSLEMQALIPDLRTLLTGMRKRLVLSPADRPARVDTDLYLAVALSLLDGKPAVPVAGASATEIAKVVAGATAAQGIGELTLFGTKRSEDYSQFKPRGHYTDVPDMQQYFRAMIWLGRIDLRLIETQPDGSPVFQRDQYAAMLLMHELVAEDLEIWRGIDDAVRTFVGESDYMVLGQVDALIKDLGGAVSARSASDKVVMEAIGRGGYGHQQIASHLMVNDGTVETLPLNRSFALFGQRYVVDSHVFSEVVYDRLKARRMMANPLDAAFAALGNNQALALDPDLDKYTELPGALSRMRVLVDAHDGAFWDANFYNLWLRAIRALSPASDLSDPRAAGKPEVTGTEAWGRRILNAQLGSWAELRHDTLLYAKQSYTGIPGCDFPDAYVDPYPEVFAAVRKYAEQGSRIVALATKAESDFGAGVATYFDKLRSTATRLETMARAQQAGTPFAAEDLAFINDAVRIEKQSVVCTTIDVPDGWYADLFYERDSSIKFDPTIADVHTQPADEVGNIVGRVLHVGTGYPRLMVVTVDTCMGPRAYAGVVFAYHELVTKDFERLTDETWAGRVRNTGAPPADVTWMAPLLSP
jgi:Protein of unknown function (DUF3160)